MQSSGVPFFVSGGGSGGGGSAFSWEGAWDAGTTYAADDVVEYNGSSYIALQAGTNKQPDTQAAYWELMAEKGDTGAAGAAGAPGATGAKGDKGDTGDTGATGPGVATAGTTGQYLKKASNTNYDTAWATFALVNADIDAGAAIAYSKLSLTGSVVNADVSASAAIAYSKLALTGSVVNADVSASAAIAYSKLSLTGSIVNADVGASAAIAYSKLSLSGSIVNADVNASAAIGWSKVSKTGSSLADLATRSAGDLNSGTLPLARLSGITDTEISASAAIAWSKISKTSSSLADLATRTTSNLTDFPSQTSNANKALVTSGSALSFGYPMGCFVIACSDETTAITTGTAKVTFRAPFAFTIPTIPRASLTAASTSGIPTVDINEAGTSILSTKLTIDANELTSTTAATAAVLSDTSIADDAEITIDIDVAGTGAKGLKVYLYYVRS